MSRLEDIETRAKKESPQDPVLKWLIEEIRGLRKVYRATGGLNLRHTCEPIPPALWEKTKSDSCEACTAQSELETAVMDYEKRQWVSEGKMSP